ncbi:TetR family transcriptional regulator [Longimycelium tulufanense]|uniref:TetR family transcriptional regulator n=1 Tax=Longimycelium tulufanense TaxID=907463 RepID=A0A8J3FW94_9PSEU|nr:TetR family transcriptional regulator [Longimycelium tulufanense]GGM75176.1 TetR family transcriptional regulator [Longimycelium tulufanense]
MSVRAEPASLRERKKQRTHAALVDAAVRLFRARGYDATTVEEIAAAVEVSPRTFFRYFDGKEEVALAPFVEFDRLLVDALADRPAAERPLPALRAAYETSLTHLAGDRGVLDRFLTAHFLTGQTPALLAGRLRRQADTERLLAAEIARRCGTGDDDVRPHLLVQLVFAAARVGFETGCRRGVLDQPEKLAASVVHALDLATAGLTRHWGEPWA